MTFIKVSTNAITELDNFIRGMELIINEMVVNIIFTNANAAHYKYLIDTV